MTLTSSPARHVEPVSIFFDDLDALGMVYHGRYVTLVDHAMTSCFATFGMTLGHEDINVLIREVTIGFEQPITAIGTVDCAIWVKSVGRTSATFGFRFQTGEVVHAKGHRVVVKIGAESGRPEPWTDATRQLFVDRLNAPEPQPAAG
jgi:acyl-CoA thioester hydrolase